MGWEGASMKKRTRTPRGESRDESANRSPQDNASRDILGDWVLPAVFVILALLTLALIVFAAGILSGVIPYD